MPAVHISDPHVTSAKKAIEAGDLDGLARLLGDHPALAVERIERRGGALTLLHFAADWPGHFPNGAETIRLVVEAGGHVDGRTEGKSSETPLHWAASCNDIAVLDALLDCGADIDAPGAFGGPGGPLDNAVGFGQWAAARRLVERGARVKLWHVAALGMSDELEAFFTDPPEPAADEITEAFWQARHGGQQQAAEYLRERGADINWIGYSDATPLDMARAGAENDGAPTCDPEILALLVGWLETQGGRTASDVR